MEEKMTTGKALSNIQRMMRQASPTPIPPFANENRETTNFNVM